MTHGWRKSDRPVVPAKSSNNGGRPAAEAVEGRGLAKGNTGKQNAPRTQSRMESASNALGRVREAARRGKEVKFTALLHHITVERLRSAFDVLHRDAAAGVDGVSWSEYAESLLSNLEDLHSRVHRGSYRASATRRVYIEKSDGRFRPLGIATLEDKILQRAVVSVLDAIYEEDFLGYSYGFRRGRSQHDALDALFVGITKRKVNWVLDADIRGFFDALDHEWLVKFLEHRIGDRRILRLIQKWLRSGVMEDGKWHASTRGTPQGATISPLLGNVYLHYVLDLWVQQWRKRNALGDMIFVRYADDFIVGFERQEEAERFLEELNLRLRDFSLEIQPEKTRLLEFGRFAAYNRRARGLGRPETFEFLGFTHCCAQSSRGRFLLKRITSRHRIRRTLKAVGTALLGHRHSPLPEQGLWLGSVVRGFNAYYGVPGNSAALNAFRQEVIRHWMRALRRRSDKDRTSWKRMWALVAHYLPKARVQHPWPDERLVVNT